MDPGDDLGGLGGGHGHVLVLVLGVEVTGLVRAQPRERSATGEDSRPVVETSLKSTTYDMGLNLVLMLVRRTVSRRCDIVR